MNRILNFFITGIKHQSTLISNFFRNVLIANSSHMLTNVNTILKFLDVKHNDLLELNKYQTKKLFQAKVEKQTGDVILFRNCYQLMMVSFLLTWSSLI